MFRGFPADTLRFFKEIARNNKREWYFKNKERYQANVVTPAQALVEDLNANTKLRKLGLKGQARNPLFRLMRDTRFSSDKSLYKTYNGLVLSRSGFNGDQGVLYLHIQPGESFMAAGFWQPDPKLLTRFRLKSIEQPTEFKKLLTGLKRNKLKLSDEDTLKRLPRGFENVEDDAHAEFLKLKSLVVSQDLRDSDLGSRALVEKIARFAAQAQPLLSFGWPIVDRWRMEGGDTEFLEKVAKKSQGRSRARNTL